MDRPGQKLHALRDRVSARKYQLLDAGLIALIGAACLVFFREPILTDRCYFPWDMADYSCPTQRFVSDTIHRGALPLWDPYVFSGFPISGDVPASLLYPPTVLSFLVPGTFPLRFKVVELVWILHVFLAGMGTYLLARKLALHRAGSLIAATVFMFGGFFPMHAEHDTWVKATAWIPLILLLYLEALSTRRVAFVLGAGLALGMSILAGYTSTSVYTAYLLLFFCLHQSAAYIKTRDYRQAITNLLLLGLIVSIGLGLSAAHTLPAYEYLGHTRRGETDYSQSVALGVTPLNVLTMVVPGAFGMSKSLPSASPYLAADPTVNQLYLGLPTLALALVGLTSKNRYRGFFLSLSLVSVLLASGSLLPVYRTYMSLLPLLSLFRRPQAFYPFFVLAIAILGGMGATILAQEGRRRGTRLAAISLSVVAGLCAATACIAEYLRFLGTVSEVEWLSKLTQPLEYLSVAALDSLLVSGATIVLLLAVLSSKQRITRYVQPMFIMLLFLDLYYANGNQHFNCAGGNPDTVVHERGAYGVVLPGIDLIRDDHLLGQYRVALGPYGGAWDNVANVIRVESINGYNPLLMKTYSELISAVGGADSSLLDLLNVRYIVSNEGFLTADGSPDFAGRLNLFGQGHIQLITGMPDLGELSLVDSSADGWYQLYERHTVLPRFFGVNQFEVIADKGLRLAKLQEPDFDPGRVAILENPFGGELAGNLQALSLACYQANGYSLVAEVDGGSILLVMSEIFYPGWKAYVDGESREILRVDHTFRGLYLEEGKHEVLVVFDPLAFKLGLLVSTVTSASVAGMLVYVSLRRCGRRVAYVAMALTILVPISVGWLVFSASRYNPRSCVSQDPTITRPMRADVGGTIAFLGYDLFPEDAVVEAGDTVALSLYWQAQDKIHEDYTVFVHLLDEADKRWMQRDNWPAYGTRPTSGWAVGEVVRDGHSFELPPDIPPGTYRIVIGLYVRSTMERLPVLDGNGQPSADGVIALDTTITVTDQRLRGG